MTATKQTELLPCPFCGGEPLLQEHPAHSHSLQIGDWKMPDHPGSWTVECCACNCGMINNSLDALTKDWNTRAQSAEPVQGEAWIDAATRNPEIERGRDIEVLVAVRRKHNGKIYVFTTNYLSAYPVIYQDQVIQDDDNDQPEITGWFYLSDDEETWHRTLSEGDELLAWMYKPAYPLYASPAKPDAELVELLRDERNYGPLGVSCQIGMVERCVCKMCRMKRIDAKLAELQPCSPAE